MNQRKCENVSYDLIAQSKCVLTFCLFLKFRSERRAKKEEEENKNNQINSKNTLEHSDTNTQWDTLLSPGLRFHLMRTLKTSNKLYNIVLLVSIERQWDWFTQTPKHTHTWLVLKQNSSNENWCLSRNYCFSLSTINSNHAESEKMWAANNTHTHTHTVYTPNDFLLAKRFSNEREDVFLLCFYFSFLFCSFRSCDEMNFKNDPCTLYIHTPKCVYGCCCFICVVDGLSS